MKFITYLNENGRATPGLLEGNRVFDLSPLGFRDLEALIAGGADALRRAADLSRSGAQSRPAAEIQLLAPLLHPPRIFCVGLNYLDHAAESKMVVPQYPTIFMKLPSAITGPGSDIVLPAQSSQPDYEAELAVVIGRGGSRISADTWREHVFGYTILNDVSARDVQLATSQWTLGKSFPTFCPLGPWIVTADEIPDPHGLEIQLSIDGEVLQHANTREFIFDIPKILGYISNVVPLEPGDIVSTGTPSGVGLGRTPHRWLKSGEEIAIEVSGIGTLRNRTRAER